MFRFCSTVAIAAALLWALLDSLHPAVGQAQGRETATPAAGTATVTTTDATTDATTVTSTAAVTGAATTTGTAPLTGSLADATAAPAEEEEGTPEPEAEATAVPAPAATEEMTKSVDVADAAVVTATATAEAGAEIGRQSFTIHFDDFDAPAELTYPLEGEGPFPTLLLIAGSGAEDMDASICSFSSPEPLSQNFRLIAEELPKHGFAVLRYNKHYVTGPCQADYVQFYTNVDLPLLYADAELVLAAAQANELVDPNALYLFGWSEGSTIAAGLTVSNSDAVAGLVLQAPVALSWYDTFLYQFANVQLPVIRELAADGEDGEDGVVVPETLLALVSGNTGLVASGGLSYLADPQVMMQNELALNPFFDTDEDGAIDIDTELLPNLRAYLDQLFEPGGVFGIYAESGGALPTLNQQAPLLKQPVLILQGENDANVPHFGAELLDVLLAGNPDHRLLLYPGLGHSLAPTESVVADNFGPMAPEPMEDLVDWLLEQVEE